MFQEISSIDCINSNLLFKNLYSYGFSDEVRLAENYSNLFFKSKYFGQLSVESNDKTPPLGGLIT